MFASLYNNYHSVSFRYLLNSVKSAFLKLGEYIIGLYNRVLFITILIAANVFYNQ